MWVVFIYKTRRGPIYTEGQFWNRDQSPTGEINELARASPHLLIATHLLIGHNCFKATSANEYESGERQPMEFPVPSLGTIQAVWEWSKRNIELWVQTLKNPASVLSSIDLQATQSTIAAIQFSAFPISISILIELPLYLMTKDPTLGFSGYVVAKIVAYSAFVVIYAIAQRFSAMICFGHGKLNACFIATLYAAAFWPPLVLTNFFMTNLVPALSSMSTGDDAALILISGLTKTQVLSLVVNALIGGVLIIYLIRKFSSMAGVTHGVGRVRSSSICLGTMVIGTPMTWFFAGPLWKMFYGFDLPF